MPKEKMRQEDLEDLCNKICKNDARNYLHQHGTECGIPRRWS